MFLIGVTARQLISMFHTRQQHTTKSGPQDTETGGQAQSCAAGSARANGKDLEQAEHAQKRSQYVRRRIQV